MASPLTNATCGISALDGVLSGIFWGDNVVFRTASDGAATEAFTGAFAGADGYAGYGVVRFAKGRPAGVGDAIAIVATDPDLNRVIAEVLAFGRELGPGGLIVFDDLAALVDRHGEEGARRFFLRVCPSLLRVGAVACWTLGPGVSDALAEEVRAITQIVIRVEDDRLTITKAEARPRDVVGTTLSYGLGADGRPQVQEISAAMRLGAALAQVRIQRGLSQSQISRLAGVSPSAISQAERGQRGLSVSTLMRLATALGVSLDALVVGQAEPGYRIRGRMAPHRGGASRVALVDSGETDFRLYEFRLDPGAHGTPPAHPRGTEIVLLGQGLLMVTMTDGSTPVIREGEALVAQGTGVADWKNVDEDQAIGFWIVV
jgi:transcriptional regulator with XRE-family HTH domain